MEQHVSGLTGARLRRPLILDLVTRCYAAARLAPDTPGSTAFVETRHSPAGVVNANGVLSHDRRSGVDPPGFCPAILSVRVVIAGLLGRRAQLLQRREQSRLALLPEPVALAPNVEHMAVVEQPAQDGRGDDGAPPQESSPIRRSPCWK